MGACHSEHLVPVRFCEIMRFDTVFSSRAKSLDMVPRNLRVGSIAGSAKVPMSTVRGWFGDPAEVRLLDGYDVTFSLTSEAKDVRDAVQRMYFMPFLERGQRSTAVVMAWGLGRNLDNSGRRWALFAPDYRTEDGTAIWQFWGLVDSVEGIATVRLLYKLNPTQHCVEVPPGAPMLQLWLCD